MKKTETKITELKYPIKEKLTHFPLKETQTHQDNIVNNNIRIKTSHLYETKNMCAFSTIV